MTSPSEVPAPTPPRPTPPSAGERLQAARKARSWSVQEVAGRLRLRAALIEALERNDHAPFGAATYARGHTRNYARLLGLDGQELLGSVQPVAAEGSGKRLRRAPELHPVRPWLVRLGGITVVGTLAVLGVFWAGAGRDPPTRLPERAAARTVHSLPSGSVPVPSQPALAAREASATPALLPSGLAPTAGASPLADTGATPPEVVPAAAVAIDSEPTLVLRARALSWVDVTDATGRRLVYELINPGAERVVSGQPPLRILLGNAPAMVVLYNGEPVQLPAGQQVVKLALGHVAQPAGQAPQGTPPLAPNP